MTGSIELDRDGRTLRIDFPYREDLLEEVRALPGRRWDRASKTWRVSATHAELVVTTFMRYGFQVSAEVASILAGTSAITTAAPEPAPADARPAEIRPADRLSVKALQDRVRASLRSSFPETLLVVGEVLDFDKGKGRKHAFFRLVEKSPTGQEILAQVEVALFERAAQRILPVLAREGLALADGMQILVEGRIDLYSAQGRLQLVIEDVRPEFTLGQIALTREAILRELRELGLDGRNRALPLPLPTLRIAVLASPDSDGWNDLWDELRRSGIGFDIALHPVRVQGSEMKPTVLGALRWFADRAADFDVLCIVRGGGSKGDLSWFDDREIALAVARHPLRILCGIGHERDQTVLDVIATSYKTPTALGGFLIEQVRHACAQLADRARELQQCVRSRLSGERSLLGGAAGALVRESRRSLSRELERIGGRARVLSTATRARVRAERSVLRTATTDLVRGVARRLELARLRIDQWDSKQRLLDPVRVLERGYAVVRGADGRIATSAKRLKRDERIRIVLRDGSAVARIEDTSTETG
jgi:exodeoxyribonuclease VII large subunit